ncbi:L-arabinose transport system permease protein AraQ [Sporomusa silvacetica DSM 10669]|jgi:multiple sugar transport system permease protein/sn-glycerol 3-phosphate transport system permease protein|uniref:L-arabinose transport system permease protein AraQ n=1 Tax=Sporomusa silvacetica DSM 10669 TaxID=1123289 RepID=A0ABZ3IIS4_9FIRM|nr:carbohydrate ABC transporter permease [Sporomusa silvacetica]OZC18384.1 L-arabinose transport system permease protein AraQ [Sporomusa silvacetica DSM 10669]
MKGKYVVGIVNNFFLILITIAVLLPFLWMVSVSFKPTNEVFQGGLWFFPTTIVLDGYRQVFEQTQFFTWMYNSMFIAGVSTCGQVVIAFLAAYAFVRFNFPGRDILFYFVLATMIIPVQALMIPTFITINLFGMINTLAGVIIPYLASGYAIFLMRQSFLAVPKELADAAAVDGCGELGIIWHVYLPAAIPAVAALSIILFVNHWNEYYWPLLVLTDEQKLTLPIALVHFQSEGFTEWVPTMAVATLSTIPVLILYLFTQKKFVEGSTNSGLKG